MNWSLWSHFQISHDVYLPLVCLIVFLIFHSIDEDLSTLKSLHVLNLLARKCLFEVELDLINVDASIEHAWLICLQNVMKFLEASIGREGFGLNLVLVCFFVKTEAISCNRCIHC
jgi:hypothetical protein